MFEISYTVLKKLVGTGLGAQWSKVFWKVNSGDGSIDAYVCDLIGGLSHCAITDSGDLSHFATKKDGDNEVTSSGAGDGPALASKHTLL